MNIVFLTTTVTQTITSDTRTTCEHATQRSAEVYAAVESLRYAGWSVRGPASSDGFRRPLLLRDEPFNSPLTGSRADQRAQGFTATRGPDVLTVDACAGLEVLHLVDVGDTAEAKTIIEGFLA